MFDRNAIQYDFNRSAHCYDAQAKLQEKIRNKATELAKGFFVGNANILDVGCGTGKFAQENSQWNVVGVDISYGMCKENRSLVANADALSLPFADNSFDGAFSSLALQWIEKPELAVKEILRVLKPESVAVITTFVNETLRELEAAFKEVDNFPHISDFVQPSDFLLKISHLGAKILEVNEQEYMTYYDDIISLMKSIKSIGANNKLSTRRKSLMTPAQLKKLEKSYKLEKNKLPASWNVLTLVLEKE